MEDTTFLSGKPLQTLLEKLTPHLTDEELIAYANRLLEAFSRGAAKPETGEVREALLSERELEVLRSLAKGLTYEEIGQQLFLSLNTVQFHVKNIYRKPAGEQASAGDRESPRDEFDLSAAAKPHIYAPWNHMIMWFFFLSWVIECNRVGIA